jgi:hypothetical protein
LIRNIQNKQPENKSGINKEAPVKRWGPHQLILEEYVTDTYFHSVVFSYRTKMLDLIEISLRMKGIFFQRIDGKTSVGNRCLALKSFREDPNCTVILASIGAVAEGCVVSSQLCLATVEANETENLQCWSYLGNPCSSRWTPLESYDRSPSCWSSASHWPMLQCDNHSLYRERLHRESKISWLCLYSFLNISSCIFADIPFRQVRPRDSTSQAEIGSRFVRRYQDGSAKPQRSPSTGEYSVQGPPKVTTRSEDWYHSRNCHYC